jgi:DHA1 family bicyclomycin/chloramphenicol resistance-like MFS transporter
VHAGLLAASFGTMFAYITGSSAVFIDMLGVSSAGYGALFALTAAGTIGGAAAPAGPPLGPGAAAGRRCRRFRRAVRGAAGRRPVRRPFGGGGGRLRPVGNVCAGIVMPQATHHALATVGHVAGSASALLRSIQMLAGASAGALIGLLGGNPLSVMAAVMALSSLLGILFLWLRRLLARAPASPMPPQPAET